MLLQVAGPPCAGKSTRLRELAGQGWAVHDEWDWFQERWPDTARDTITQPMWDGWREHLRRVVATTPADVDTAFVFGRPRPLDAVVQIEVIDPGAEVCHRRATEDGRPGTTHGWIDRWYAKWGLIAAERAWFEGWRSS